MGMPIKRAVRRHVGCVVFAAMTLGQRALAATQLPSPCTASVCGGNVKGFVTSGKAGAVAAGKTLTVTQTSANATLNWSSFNISADGKVVFNQPSSSAVALNRIYDANPSSIFGALTANGQIYLINANGFLFGSTARVNVAGLIASSLNITDNTFSSGILSPIANSLPALQQFVDSSGNPILNTGSIVVQPGAQLTAADSGRLLLAAPTVSNGGSLTSPDGQIVLAAGQNVYLQAAGVDSPVRGLIVEVDGGTGAAQQLTTSTAASTGVTNQASGQLSTPRGNVTLVGLAVNQDGRISATTSVAANGSVILEAAQGFGLAADGKTISATQGGTLTLGSTSSIDILPEYADTATAVPAQAQAQSQMQLTGQQVLMHGGSIDAPGGDLAVLAASNPSSGAGDSGDTAARIRIDAGTSINLAGSNADLPMDANLVTVQLRSNEFADDPAQRNGALRGQTVVIDARADGGLGTPIADVASAIAAVGQNIAQRTETGGTATFTSGGDVVFNPGAAINVSGGATTYEAGSIQTTALVGANGQLYSIGSANPLLTYKGVVNPTFTQTYDKWGVSEIVPTPGLSQYESSYQQGAAAGTVQFAAPSLLLQGTLQGAAVNGPYQRANPVSGGTLLIGLPGGFVAANPLETDFLAPAVTLTNTPVPIVISDAAALPAQTLQLPADYLTTSGFSVTKIYSNSSITIPADLPLQLQPGATLQLEGNRIDVDSSIAALDGTLTFESILTVGSSTPGAPRAGIGIGTGVTLDASGQWTNDSVVAGGMGSAPTLQNGGSVTLRLTAPGGEVVLGDDVALKANGGAWVNAAGAVANGSGGAITLDASPSQSAVQFGAAPLVEAFGVGTANGGSFSLAAPRIAVSQGSGTAWTTAQRVDDLSAPGEVLDLYAPLFADYGFSHINLAASGAVVPTATAPIPAGVAGDITSSPSADVLTVLSGTQISAQTQTLQLTPTYETIRTGGTVAGFTQATTPPAYLRPPTDVSLSVTRGANDYPLGNADVGNLEVQAGASILLDPGASITLSGVGSVLVGGTLRAPGGTIGVQTALANDDSGYQPNQGIFLAPSAVLDVSGTTVLTPNTLGLQQGTEHAGGSVTLQATRGTVITQPGSLIDIAGTSATLDIVNSSPSGGYTPTVVGSAGGSLVVSSPESISLLGNLSAAAGVGVGGTAAAGSLEVDLVRSGGITEIQLPQFPGSKLTIDLVDSTAGASPAAANSNLALLGAQQLERSGIDSLTLRAGGQAAAGTILLDTAQLSLGRQIVFDTPNLAVANGVNATLVAPYVEIGNTQVLGASGSAPSLQSGTGRLAVSAQQIDLLGNFALNGVASATFTSAGDVQLQGTLVEPTGPEIGSIATNGNLTLNAERVYPDTYTDFTLASQGTGATVTIGRNGASPGTPLSGGSTVAVSADNIVISGSLLAPFGTIDLAATDTLTLTKGSLVSVSGAGIDVPYGETQLNGAQWIYNTSGSDINTVSAVPAKQVTVSAPNVTVQSGATINIEGGGNLYAYEWVPGTGGTYDRLSSNPTTAGYQAGLYAIMPTAKGQAAPYDPEESTFANATQTVYLTGGAGLAAGFYALLPARYALEPGAQLIQLESGYAGVTAGQVGALGNGTPIIAGYLSSGTTGLRLGNTEYQGFAVYPAGYAQSIAAYDITQASTYFGAAATLAGKGPVSEPADAGAFTLSITPQPAVTPALSNLLDLQGSVLTAAASGGRGALVNISAPELEITAGTAGTAGSITVSSTVLQSWNASQLTLGGTSTPASVSEAGSSSGSSTTSSIAVAANSVTVDAGVSLTADQIELVAQQSIDVKSGAMLASTSGKSGSVLATLPSQQAVTLNDAYETNASANLVPVPAGTAAPLPQGALLAVSDLDLPVVSRSATTASGATITLEAGASLKSGGALALDSPGTVTVADGSVAGKGASWSLGSGSIAFVGNGTSTDTLNLDSALVTALQGAGAVRLAALGSPTAAGSIDLYAPVALGATGAAAVPTLSALTLQGSAINNESGGNVVFGADTVTLGGAVTTPPAAAAPGTGTLAFVGDNVVVGPGFLTVNGFGRTQVQAAGAVQGAGAGGLYVGGALAVNAVELTAAPDGQDTQGTTLSATGALTIGTATLRSGSTLPTLVGGNLSLLGNGIDDAGAIVVPAGLVNLNAGTGNLTLAPAATIDAAGKLLSAVDQTAAAPGGAVTLVAGGNVTLDSGSSISVAGAGSAPAGSLSITGAGTVTLSASLAGGSTTATGGSFKLDAGTLAGGLAPLAATLNPGGKGGFSNLIDIRVANGNLDLPAGETMSANSVALTADTGVVDIAGTIAAPSAATRGAITVSGGTGVVLEASGQLLANGSGPGGRGGEIEINSTCATCAITLDAGSVVQAAGSAQMGELVLRAPALVATNDVAINDQPGAPAGIGADVSQAGQVIVEPVVVFQETAAGLANGDLGTDVSTAAGFLATAAPTIGARLTSPSTTPISVQVGAEIQDNNPADAITLGAFDFYQNNSASGQVVNLTLRAAGSITLDGTLSDGLAGSAKKPALVTTASGSLSLVAGADLSSANPTGVLLGSTAALTLGPGSVVRTGTGDISLAAAGDVVFGDGSSAYTAGLLAAPSVFKNLMNFGADGGNVHVAAGGDVVSQLVDGDAGDFSVTGWQLRQVVGGGATGEPVAVRYGNDFAAFDWNVGALAGGDVTVAAGGNVNYLSAATADSLVDGKLYGAGGGLTITAGGDIGSVQVAVASGQGTLTAGGGLTALASTVDGRAVGSSFAVGDSAVAVWARQSLQVDAVYNPTYAANAPNISSAAFLTYSTASALSLSSTDGTATLELDTTNSTMGTLLGSGIVEGSSAGFLYVLPAHLTVQALQQDVVVNNDVRTILFPSSTGQLDLFAGRDILATTGEIGMSDSLPLTYPSVSAPLAQTAANPLDVAGLVPFAGDIHVGDATPALVTAGRDIDGLTLSIPKAAQVVAGRDILNLVYQGQNLATDDTTLISAGRDLSYTGDFAGITLGGPGSLDVLAGRNLNFGLGDGITTAGNLLNPNLPTAAGANVNMAVGYGTTQADLSGFLASEIVNAKAPTYQTELTNYVESLTGESALTFAAALAEFKGFTSTQQSPLIDSVFFNELLISGRAANGGSGVGFAEGYAAIDDLFPGSRNPTTAKPSPYSGNLELTSSGIYTDSGGNISILVPGGNIDVGLANAPVGLVQKPASELGIVAEGTGNIDIYSYGDVNVNTSRIFTLGGGNILIWSTTGSIDAGNGSKSSLSVPPPVILVSKTGVVMTDFGATLAAGSGIRTIQTEPSVPPGNVDLDAPVGTVNAGDAGIGSSGNINIAAAHVIGVDNINFGGTATGVPSDLSGLGASLSGVSAVASSATSSAASTVADAAAAAKEAAPLAQNALSWLDVFVTGLGEENCKPDDTECLRRQKTASP
jgi:filamentous hemagglutinin family protein